MDYFPAVLSPRAEAGDKLRANDTQQRESCEDERHRPHAKGSRSQVQTIGCRCAHPVVYITVGGALRETILDE